MGGERNAQTFHISHGVVPTNGTISYNIVDTINGVAPTSKDDLITKLYGL